jgi:hypothetical protein
MSIPRVYAAINAVAAELAKVGIPKARTNEQDGYLYRGIDDVYDRLAPLLAAHKLCILPRMLERECSNERSEGGQHLRSVTVKVAFDLISAEDGSVHVIESFGEALDPSDKGTSKAMSAAYKYAILQTFCIPISRSQDADAQSYKLAAAKVAEVGEPEQGWEQWVADVSEVVRVCESTHAIDHLQDTHRLSLHALSRERQDLYQELGRTLAGRRQQLSRPSAPPSEKKRPCRKSLRRPGPQKREVPLG